MALDIVFVLHALIYLIMGLMVFVQPDWLDMFLMCSDSALSEAQESEEFLWTDTQRQMHYQLHTVSRLYGTMMIMQSWQVWRNRAVNDAFVRRTFVQSYFVLAILTTAVLVYGQWYTVHFHFLNYLNIAFFMSMAIVYGYFLVFLPIPAFATASHGV